MIKPKNGWQQLAISYISLPSSVSMNNCILHLQYLINISQTWLSSASLINYKYFHYLQQPHMSLFITYPISCTYVFTMDFQRLQFSPILLRTSFFITLSVHFSFILHLQNHTSNDFESPLMVKVSQSYKTTFYKYTSKSTLLIGRLIF